MSEPVHTRYSDAEQWVFPGAITLIPLLSGAQTDGSLAVFEDVVEPGVGPGRHIHLHQDETFFFLDGDFVVEIDGVLHRMAAGDVGFVPRGAVHAFRNVGQRPGRLRYVFSPALTVEAMFAEFYQAQQAGQLDEAAMQAIAERHGQRFVGPPLEAV